MRFKHFPTFKFSLGAVKERCESCDGEIHCTQHEMLSCPYRQKYERRSCKLGLKAPFYVSRQ